MHYILLFKLKVKREVQFSFPATCDPLNFVNHSVDYLIPGGERPFEGRYPVATVATFSCDGLGNLTGDARVTCQTAGRWVIDKTAECDPGKEMNIIS